MRTPVHIILLCASLPLLVCGARAQPTQAESGRDVRCREAALKYVHPSPDKEHLTEEAEQAYEYRQQKMYLRVCGDSDDDLTRNVKEWVALYEAGRTLARLLPVAGKSG